LIELATTTTNADREEIKENWKIFKHKREDERQEERRQFFTDLVSKQNVAENAAFSFILKYMMKSMADNANTKPSYKRNEEFSVDENHKIEVCVF
jgi:hypothetical protein